MGKLEFRTLMLITSKWIMIAVKEQTRNYSNFPVRGIFKNPREIIVNMFR